MQQSISAKCKFYENVQRNAIVNQSVGETWQEVYPPAIVSRITTQQKIQLLLTRAVEKADEIQRETEEMFSEMVVLCDRINTLIDKMNDVNEQIVLRYRYIENYTWTAIGKSMGYSRSTILRIHGDAIKNFSLIFKKLEHCGTL